MKLIFMSLLNIMVLILLLAGCNLSQKEIKETNVIQATNTTNVTNTPNATNTTSEKTDSNIVIEGSQPKTESGKKNNSQDNGIGFTKNELQEDFNQLKSYINSHPKLYSDIDELNRLIETNYLLIEDEMTEVEFLRLLTPIVTKLNCGHTSVYLSEDYYEKEAANLKYFPLKIYYFEGQLFVAQNKGLEQIPFGAQILMINGKSEEEITEQLLTNLPSDGYNQTLKYRVINDWFRGLYYEIVDDASSYSIKYITSDSSAVNTAEIEGTTNLQYNDLYSSSNENSKAPYSSEFNTTYAILDMDSFSPYDSYSIASYKEFIDKFFREVKDKQIEDIILDVRDNWGGDPMITSHLFSYLEKTPQPYFAKSAMDYYKGLKSDIPLAENHFEGNIYTLMNGGSFSSTGHLLALLKYQGIGTFIGEESGGSFACTDASKNHTLKNTGIQYRASTLVWEVATEGLVAGRGIMPDYEITQTLAQYVDNVDIVKEFAVKLINEK